MGRTQENHGCLVGTNASSVFDPLKKRLLSHSSSSDSSHLSSEQLYALPIISPVSVQPFPYAHSYPAVKRFLSLLLICFLFFPVTLANISASCFFFLFFKWFKELFSKCILVNVYQWLVLFLFFYCCMSCYVRVTEIPNSLILFCHSMQIDFFSLRSCQPVLSGFFFNYFFFNIKQ